MKEKTGRGICMTVIIQHLFKKLDAEFKRGFDILPIKNASRGLPWWRGG